MAALSSPSSIADESHPVAPEAVAPEADALEAVAPEADAPEADVEADAEAEEIPSREYAEPFIDDDATLGKVLSDIPRNEPLIKGLARDRNYWTKGVNGVVYRGIHNGDVVAMKVVNKSEGLKEVAILRHISGAPGIILALAFARDERYMYIVMPYVRKTLYDVQEVALTRQEYKQLILQLLQVIQFLHSVNISHNDLKPSNVLLTEDGKSLKVIDYGLSDTFRCTARMRPHYIASRWYRTPESLQGVMPRVPDIDWWAACVLIVEVLNFDNAKMHPLSDADTCEGVLEKLRCNLPKLVGTETERFVRQFLQEDPAMRVAPGTLLQSSFFPT